MYPAGGAEEAHVTVNVVPVPPEEGATVRGTDTVPVSVVFTELRYAYVPAPKKVNE